MENNYHMAYPPPDEHGTSIRHGSPHQPYHGYRHAPSSAIDPGLQNHRSSFGGSNPARMAGSPSPRQVRAGSMRSLQSSPRMLQSSPRFQRTGTPTSTVGRAAYSMSPPPHLDSASRGAQRLTEHPAVQNPALLPREITDSNIDDIYVKFILYANPGVPRDVDTTELRRVFRAPPRSDGKSFSIYTLWQLIKKLESKELKTWSQLAIELGVEPPCTERGQSSQKIQQYAVRLKRWMRAMHIDAFFEFCLGKPHRYYNELPTPAANASEEGRDGVPLEEDLALRALMPEWRPKRGRRKNEDKESDMSTEPPPAKHPRLDSHHSAVEYDGLGVHSAIFPGSAAPWSAYPDDMNHDAWAMGSGIPPGHDVSTSAHPNVLHGRAGYDFPRWRRDVSPTVYPYSAVTLSHRQPEHVVNEPQSAITPSVSKKSQTRRRHGPAVSSAWPSKGSSTSNGKQRGRPPSSKPPQEEAPPALSSSGKSNRYRDGTPTTHGEEQGAVSRNLALQNHLQQMPPSQSRPNKLQLQVPERLGGPVRLATPPTLLVNGNGRLRRNSVDYFRHSEGDDEDDASVVSEGEKRSSETAPQHDFTVEDVARAFATRLLQVKIIGRPDGLSLEEANTLASKATLSICSGVKAGLVTASSHLVLAIKCAILLGVEKEMGILSTSNSPADDSSHLSVRCVFQNPDGSISRSRKPNQSNNTNKTDTKGSYNYTISIDKTIDDNINNGSNKNNHRASSTRPTMHGTLSSNIQIRDLIVPFQSTSYVSASANILPLDGNAITDEEIGFAQLREQVKNLSEVPASAIEPPTAGADGDGTRDGDGVMREPGDDSDDSKWKQRFWDVRRDEKVAEEKLRRLKRLMLEVVMGSK